MTLVIKKDYEELSRWAAEYVAARIKSHEDPGSGRPFVLGLPTGASPLGTYRELIRIHRECGLSFARVKTFNMDEYLGVGPDHPQSYHVYMRENFFNALDIKLENTWLPDGLAPDPDAECRAYEEAIAAAGGIDLFLGGLGSNGHIAFNEPGSSPDSRTRAVVLSEETRIANARYFGGDMEKVPKMALTVGIGTIMDAREVLIIASGSAKAEPLRSALENAPSPWKPLSCLRAHPRFLILCDEEAAAGIGRGTL
jgi:glucosamine-6-phosphate deaminase